MKQLNKWSITVKMRDGTTHGVEWENARRFEVAADFRKMVKAWHEGRVVAYEGDDFAWAVAAQDIISLSVSIDEK